MKRKIIIVFFIAIFTILLSPFCFSGPFRDFFSKRREAIRERLLERNERSFIPGQTQEVSIAVGATTRYYRIYLPFSYSRIRKFPVILNFHGGGSNAQQHEEMTHMNEKADKEEFIIVYPQGTGLINSKKLGTWNAGENCCGVAQKKNINDILFVKELLKDLRKSFNIDNKRIYVTGFSNGAIFCYRLACELSNQIAAIASVAGHLDLSNCMPFRSVPILDIKGLQDKCVLYEGGVCGGCLGKKTWPCPGADENLEYFSQLYGCGRKSQVKFISDNAYIESYENCNQRCEITLLTIKNLGHQWAGGEKMKLSEDKIGPYVAEPEINEEIFKFFKKYSLP